ncbi:MAG: biotin/lipoyl-binding protein [Sodalis sp. (in: enterobacteria)]|uniref:biotin/lipoyl-binding protein n=1 Tax=Sodalis sp. (in: enterobacteria) TaxID=1898979 RepID=UPI0039E6E433
MMLLLLLAVVVIYLVTFGLYYWLHGRFYESTDDAYVTGNMVQITPQVAGTVTTIAADNGDYVKQGQLLVRRIPAIPSWRRRAPRPIWPGWCAR